MPADRTRRLPAFGWGASTPRAGESASARTAGVDSGRGHILPRSWSRSLYSSRTTAQSQLNNLPRCIAPVVNVQIVRKGSGSFRRPNCRGQCPFFAYPGIGCSLIMRLHHRTRDNGLAVPRDWAGHGSGRTWIDQNMDCRDMERACISMLPEGVRMSDIFHIRQIAFGWRPAFICQFSSTRELCWHQQPDRTHCEYAPFPLE